MPSTKEEREAYRKKFAPAAPAPVQTSKPSVSAKPVDTTEQGLSESELKGTKSATAVDRFSGKESASASRDIAKVSQETQIPRGTFVSESLGIPLSTTGQLGFGGGILPTGIRREGFPYEGMLDTATPGELERFDEETLRRLREEGRVPVLSALLPKKEVDTTGETVEAPIWTALRVLNAPWAVVGGGAEAGASLLQEAVKEGELPSVGESAQTFIGSIDRYMREGRGIADAASQAAGSIVEDIGRGIGASEESIDVLSKRATLAGYAAGLGADVFGPNLWGKAISGISKAANTIGKVPQKTSALAKVVMSDPRLTDKIAKGERVQIPEFLLAKGDNANDVLDIAGKESVKDIVADNATLRTYIDMIDAKENADVFGASTEIIPEEITRKLDDLGALDDLKNPTISDETQQLADAANSAINTTKFSKEELLNDVRDQWDFYSRNPEILDTITPPAKSVLDEEIVLKLDVVDEALESIPERVNSIAELDKNNIARLAKKLLDDFRDLAQKNPDEFETVSVGGADRFLIPGPKKIDSEEDLVQNVQGLMFALDDAEDLQQVNLTLQKLRDATSQLSKFYKSRTSKVPKISVDSIKDLLTGKVVTSESDEILTRLAAVQAIRNTVRNNFVNSLGKGVSGGGLNPLATSVIGALAPKLVRVTRDTFTTKRGAQRVSEVLKDPAIEALNRAVRSGDGTLDQRTLDRLGELSGLNPQDIKLTPEGFNSVLEGTANRVARGSDFWVTAENIGAALGKLKAQKGVKAIPKQIGARRLEEALFTPEEIRGKLLGPAIRGLAGAFGKEFDAVGNPAIKEFIGKVKNRLSSIGPEFATKFAQLDKGKRGAPGLLQVATQIVDPQAFMKRLILTSLGVYDRVIPEAIQTSKGVIGKPIADLEAKKELIEGLFAQGGPYDIIVRAFTQLIKNGKHDEALRLINGTLDRLDSLGRGALTSPADLRLWNTIDFGAAKAGKEDIGGVVSSTYVIQRAIDIFRGEIDKYATLSKLIKPVDLKKVKGKWIEENPMLSVREDVDRLFEVAFNRGIKERLGIALTPDDLRVSRSMVIENALDKIFGSRKYITPDLTIDQLSVDMKRFLDNPTSTDTLAAQLFGLSGVREVADLRGAIGAKDFDDTLKKIYDSSKRVDDLLDSDKKLGAVPAGYAFAKSVQDNLEPIIRFGKNLGGVARLGTLSGFVLPNIVYHMGNIITAPGIIAQTVGPRYAGSFLDRDAWKILNSMFKEGSDETIELGGRLYKVNDLASTIVSNSLSKSQSTADFSLDLIEDVKRFMGDDALKGILGPAISKGTNVWLDSTGTNIWARIADATDTIFRTGVTVKALKEGRSLDEALQMGREALFDYGSVTDLERNTLARAIWFYSFMSRNILNSAKQAFENPNRIVGLNRLRVDFRDRVEKEKTEGKYDPLVQNIIIDPSSKENWVEDAVITSPPLPIFDGLNDVVSVFDTLAALGRSTIRSASGEVSYTPDVISDGLGWIAQQTGPLNELAIALTFGINKSGMPLSKKPQAKLINAIASVPGAIEKLENSPVLPVRFEKIEDGSKNWDPTFPGVLNIVDGKEVRYQYRVLPGYEKNWKIIETMLMFAGVRRLLADYGGNIQRFAGFDKVKEKIENGDALTRAEATQLITVMNALLGFREVDVRTKEAAGREISLERPARAVEGVK